MSNYIQAESASLFDRATGTWIGMIDLFGREQQYIAGTYPNRIAARTGSLFDAATGAWIGVYDLLGQEQQVVGGIYPRRIAAESGNLYDPVTGAWVGALDLFGREQIAAAQYLGQVATNCRMPTAAGLSSANTTMTRSLHYNRAGKTLAKLQLRYPGWFVNGSLAEVGSGDTITITASIEYPLGTKNQVTWTGSPSHAIASGADGALSDEITLSTPIPAGEMFWVRTWQSSPGLLVLRTQGGSVNADSANNEVFRRGTNIADQTMSGGTLLSGGTVDNGSIFSPMVILAQTTQPAVYILGDSRALGVGDTYTGVSGDKGAVARSIGPYFAYSNFAKSGDSASAFVASNAKRLGYAQYFSHLFLQMGYNDIINFSAAVTLANLAATRALFPGLEQVQSTAGPNSTSSDSWATTVNQTASAVKVQKTILNTALRAGISGVTIFDTSSVIMTATDSDIWLANGTPSYYTNDGIHERVNANLLIQASGAINPARFTR